MPEGDPDLPERPKLPELPNEVLGRIIGMLARPIPPGDIPWKDAHQDDLTRMMRVSKVCTYRSSALSSRRRLAETLS